MPLRMIAADLDKTLLRSSGTLSDFTAETLLRCRDAGVRIVIATARTESYCEEVIRALQPDAVISNSGALARAGVAVANASLSTAAAAAHHCETNDEDGVALWLRRRFAPIFA